MAKQSFSESEWRSDSAFRALCRAVLSCQNEAELADFLRDAATLSELKEMSERWAIVRDLATGKSYVDVSERTGASTATVTRVARFLFDGTGGYRQALASLGLTSQHHRRHSRREKTARLRRR